MTNYERNKSFLKDNSSCPACGAFLETILHVLKDCLHTRILWDWFVSPSSHGDTYSRDLRHWLTTNLNAANPLSCGEPSQSSLFASITWQSWKQRNKYVFNGLLLAWNLGCTRLIVQFDSSRAINLVTEMNASYNQLSLVRAIVNLCSFDWDVPFEWIPRTCNRVANRIAKLAPMNHFDLVQYTLPPLDVSDLFQDATTKAPRTQF
ncbi:hypothetical protein F3Y22_tig00111059pilonHSYRG00256 [Hibiscus syriacus]|uniref:RNase H type-1 domain-containing protein n=1 Tax=Hibiscus syriacus TaxID=106335 RepID=A0A6A2Z4M2_HIBSY|nr:hypothetical protein F3Y22_tig00111059pilonHSYRG00256 [Hibiscus syriacus]